MYGEGALGEIALGESPRVGVAIIPEVTRDTKLLVLAVELDLLLPGLSSPTTEIDGFEDETFWISGHGWVD